MQEATPQVVPLRNSQHGAELPAAPTVDLDRIERAVREILFAIGEEPTREGLLETPARVARAYAETVAGLTQDPSEHLSKTFSQEAGGVVALRDIDFWSLCEHHLLPFSGRAHVAYRPGNGRVAGLSKLARTVDVFARRPQLQERLTAEIADALYEHLGAEGVTVVVEAEHLCMQMRGVSKQGATMRTTAHRGSFASDSEARREALSALGS